MDVFLIRHTSVDVAEGFIYGRTDVKLSGTYFQETVPILSQLPIGIDVVYTSPSQRCLTLAKEINLNPQIDERLYELNFGDWEGKTWNTINRQDSEYWMEDYINRSPPEGESMKQMQKRVSSFWEDLLEINHQTVVMVTHGGVIRVLLSLVNKTELKSAFDNSVRFGQVFKIKI